MVFFNFVVFSENFNFMIVGNSLVLHNFICQITAVKELFFFSNSDIVQPSKFDHDYCDSSQINQFSATRLDNFVLLSLQHYIPVLNKNERKKPKAFDFLVNYIFLLLLVCLYSLFLCFKFSYSKCVEFEIDKNIQH